MPVDPHYSTPITAAADLPPLVAAMRARILQACRTGDIEALRVPIDRNEVRPLFERRASTTIDTRVAHEPGADPIATLQTLSFDGQGRETLLLLRAVLTQACVREQRTIGRTRIITFVWPAFAVAPPTNPDPDERQVMLSCVRFADLPRLRTEGPLPVMRVGIGEDGVWHYFWNVAS